MALIGTFTLFGVAVPTAYAKVVKVTGDKNGWSGQMAVYAEEPPEPDPGVTPVVVQPALTMGINAAYVAGQDAISAIYEAALLLESFSQMTSDENKTKLTRLEFFQRFTAAERQAIYTAAKSVIAIEDYLRQAESATFIDITRPDTIAGVQQLEVVGLIGVGRADEILE